MADFFKGGRKGDVKVGGVFNGTDVKINIGSTSGGLVGALVQQIQITYRRQVNRILELGSDNTYYVVGRSEGDAQMQNIVGPSDSVQKAIDSLADACEVTKNVIKISADTQFCATDAGGASGNKGSVALTLEGCILTQIGITISTQDFTIVQTAGIMFSSLTK